MRTSELLAMGFLALAACSDSETTSDAGGACTASPPCPSHDRFDPVSCKCVYDADAGPPEITCSPANGESAKNIKGALCFTPAALPTGACAESAPECAIGIYYACDAGDPEFSTPRTFYACGCRSGSWECVVSSKDASMCLPGAADASSD